MGACWSVIAFLSSMGASVNHSPASSHRHAANHGALSSLPSWSGSTSVFCSSSSPNSFRARLGHSRAGCPTPPQLYQLPWNPLPFPPRCCCCCPPRAFSFLFFPFLPFSACCSWSPRASASCAISPPALAVWRVPRGVPLTGVFALRCALRALPRLAFVECELDR